MTIWSRLGDEYNVGRAGRTFRLSFYFRFDKHQRRTANWMTELLTCALLIFVFLLHFWWFAYFIRSSHSIVRILASCQSHIQTVHSHYLNSILFYSGKLIQPWEIMINVRHLWSTIVCLNIKLWLLLLLLLLFLHFFISIGRFHLLMNHNWILCFW